MLIVKQGSGTENGTRLQTLVNLNPLKQVQKFAVPLAISCMRLASMKETRVRVTLQVILLSVVHQLYFDLNALGQLASIGFSD